MTSLFFSLVLPLMLAESAPIQPVDHDFMGKYIAATIVLTTLVGGGTFLLGRRRMTVEPQPLSVKLEEHFVPRREFDNYRADVAIDFARVEAQQQRLFERVDQKHSELLETIRMTAEVGVKGRVAIWEEVNAQGKAIVAAETKVEIGERLERLGRTLLETRAPGRRANGG